MDLSIRFEDFLDVHEYGFWNISDKFVITGNIPDWVYYELMKFNLLESFSRNKCV